MKLFVTGINTNTNEEFDFKIKSQVIIDIIHLAENGEDGRIIHEIRKHGHDTPKAMVLDAMTWIDFVDDAVDMLKSGDRFAVSANGIEFGISGKSFDDAAEAVALEEF